MEHSIFASVVLRHSGMAQLERIGTSLSLISTGPGTFHFVEGVTIKEFLINLLREYGGVVLLLNNFLEYLGLPMPGETMMLFSGFFSNNSLAAAVFMFFATVGTFFGSLLAYAIGWKYGEPVVLKIGRPFHITKESLDKTNAAVEKHEAAYIIFSRFIPGVRHIVPYLTGITRLKRHRYILCNLASSVIWCAFFIAAGKLLGQQWTKFEHLAHSYALAALLILIFIFLVYQFGGKYRLVLYGVALPLIAFLSIALLQRGNRFHLFDASIYAFASGLSDLKPLFHVISQLDSVGTLALIALICAVLLWANRKYSFWGKMIAIDFTACFLLGEAVNLLFHRPRPASLGSFFLYTFPSVNSMLSVSFYGFLIYLLAKYHKRAWNPLIYIFLILLVAASGLSRVCLHQYYASDVLAGFAAGFSWLLLFIVAVNKLRPPDETVSETAYMDHTDRSKN